MAALLYLLGQAGCRNVWTEDASTPAVQSAPETTRIIYRTRTDRMNAAGGKLPACSIATLYVEAPHPEMKVSSARVTVTTVPCSADASPFPKRGLSGTISSYFEDEEPASAAPTSTWKGDVPLWQVEAIVSSLEKANFFDRQRTVFNPDVFLSVQTGQRGVGKKYRPVDELDAMLTRIVTDTAEIATVAQSQARAELARLPAIDSP